MKEKLIKVLMMLETALKRHRFFIRMLHQYLNRNQFMILSGILVGLSAGLAAMLLKYLVFYIHRLADSQLEHFSYSYFNLFLPLIGIVITVWVVRTFFRGKDGKGVANILTDIAQKSGIVPKYKMYSQVFASAITVGFGGSSGLEGPIAVTGAAIGSNYARTYRLNYRDRILLLACGTSAGIATVFNAPITGLMFSIEVLLVGIVFSDFIPLIISAVTGALLSRIILDDEILLEFKNLTTFDHYNVPFYLLLGILCGLLSIYYAKVNHYIEDVFRVLKWNAYKKALFGGLLLALLCFMFPPLFGEGYSSIKLLASNPEAILKGSFFNITDNNGWYLILFTGIIFFTKVLATSITLSSGGSGGNFAPSLFTGAFLGFFYASVINKLQIYNLPVSNFILVGMCGILSGVMYAPLTGIFLIAEITGGYELILPLMMVSTSSYLIAKFFEPYSEDVKHLVKKRKVFTDNYDQNILQQIKLHEVISEGCKTINDNATFKELKLAFKDCDEQIIICTDSNHNYIGFILFDRIRKILFDNSIDDNLSILEFISDTRYHVDTEEDLNDILQKFERSKLSYLPAFKKGKYMGYIEQARVLYLYRQKLKFNLN